MFHNAGDRIFLVSVDRAGRHAARIETVVTSRRHMLHDRVGTGSSDKQADVPPGFRLIETVQRVARRHERFAPRAGIQIDIKRVLLTGLGRSRLDELRVILRLNRRCLFAVDLRKPLNRSQLLLISEQSFEQGWTL